MEPKKNPKIDAGRNSSFYFSLGLICTLSLSFVVLQTDFVDINKNLTDFDKPDEVDFIYDPPFEKQINIVEPQVKKTVLIADKINIVDEIVETKEKEPTPVLDPVQTGSDEGTVSPQVVHANQISTPAPEIIEDKVDFIRIEDVPIFPGCEKLAKEHHRVCFEKKVKEHIMKHQRFPNQAIESNLNGRVHAQFIIDETGQIRVEDMRGSHPMFEKEVHRVLSLLPKMTPGKQRLRAVKVSYTLPFTFKID